MDQELKQYVDGKFARDLERVETALITEFHKWASLRICGRGLTMLCFR